MKTRMILLAGSFLLLSATAGMANTIENISTGEGQTTGNYWTLNTSSTTASSYNGDNAVVLSPSVGNNWGTGTWVTSTSAQWIGVSNSNSNLPRVTSQSNTYSFDLSFSTAGFNNITLTAQWAIDDEGTLSINGHIISSLPNDTSSNYTGFTGLTNVDISPYLNASGTDQIEITMTSSDRDNDGAILYGEIDGTPIKSSVPEPATMVLFGSGLVGLAGLVRRKKA